MSTPTTDSPYSRKNPFPAPLLVNRVLSKPGSSKEIRHFEISLEGSGLTYEVGDAHGSVSRPTTRRWSRNSSPPRRDRRGAGAQRRGRRKFPSARRCCVNYHITQTSKQFLEAIAARTEGESVVKELLTDPLRKDDLSKYTYGMEYIDFLLTIRRSNSRRRSS